MRKGLLALVVCGAVGLAPSLAEAQVRPWEISIVGGPSFPVGDLTDEASTGYHVQGSVGVGLPLLPFGARADLLWQELPHDDGTLRQIGGLLNAVFGVPAIVVRPYGLVGLGLLRTEEPHGDHTDDYTTVGLNAGAGVVFPFVGLSGVVEIRFLNIVGGGEAADFQTIPVSVGVRF